jgi:hypothetical protein
MMAADPGQGTVDTNVGPDVIMGTVAEADTTSVDDGIKANAQAKAQADDDAAHAAELDAEARREAEAADPRNDGPTDMTPDVEDFEEQPVIAPEGGEDGPQNPSTEEPQPEEQQVNE